METIQEQPVSTEDLKRLIQDVRLMKEILLSERLYFGSDGELSDWAKKELGEARKIPDSELISMEEIEKEFL